MQILNCWVILPGTQASRWTAAKAAAKAVIDLNQFSLYHQHTPAPGDSIAQTFVNYFPVLRLWDRRHPSSVFHAQDRSKLVRLQSGRVLAGQMVTTTGVTILLWEIWSTQYDMKDGSSFGLDQPCGDCQSSAKRRSFLCFNSIWRLSWRKRPVDVQAIDPLGQNLQVGHVLFRCCRYPTYLFPGCSTRQGPMKNWNVREKRWLPAVNLCDPYTRPSICKAGYPFRHIRMLKFFWTMQKHVLRK